MPVPRFKPGSVITNQWLGVKKELLAKLQDEKNGARKTAIRMAEAILNRALIYCPVKTGALRASGTIIYDRPTGHRYYNVSVEFRAPYARIVHEMVHYAHKPPTKAKFLELAAREVVREFDFKKGVGPVSFGRTPSGVKVLRTQVGTEYKSGKRTR